MVEQKPFKLLVLGSNPSRLTKSMIGSKYMVHYSLAGIAGVLILYSMTCDLLPYSEIVRLTKLNVNPACEVQSYKLEIPMLEIPNPITTYNNLITSNATGTASDYSPSPSAEATDLEI